MRKPNYIVGEHRERGALYAAFDSTVHHIEGRVCDSRFSARMAPFKSRDEAEAALRAAGCAAERVAA